MIPNANLRKTCSNFSFFCSSFLPLLFPPGHGHYLFSTRQQKEKYKHLRSHFFTRIVFIILKSCQLLLTRKETIKKKKKKTQTRTLSSRPASSYVFASESFWLIFVLSYEQETLANTSVQMTENTFIKLVTEIQVQGNENSMRT